MGGGSELLCGGRWCGCCGAATWAPPPVLGIILHQWAVQTLKTSVPVLGLSSAEGARRRRQQLLALVRRGPPSEEVEAVRASDAASTVAAPEEGRSSAPLKQKDAEAKEWKVVTGKVKCRRGERWDAAQAMAEPREAKRRAAAAGALQRWARGLLGRRAAAAVRAARGAAVAGCAGPTAMALPAAEAQPARHGRRGKKVKEDPKGDDALLGDAIFLAALEADELARAAADAL
ncbi:unnamed protein product, partial [Prorocentrum cordatum]